MNWTREQAIATFALYCAFPLKSTPDKTKAIVFLAEKFGRTTGSITACLANFRSCDPETPPGLDNASKLTRRVFMDYQHDWAELRKQANEIVGCDLFTEALQGSRYISDMTEHVKVSAEKKLFSQVVRAAYDNTCCLSGCRLPVLEACHISRYSETDRDTRLDPANGLLLLPVFHKLFDKGYISIDETYKVLVSRDLELRDAFSKNLIRSVAGKRITSPKGFWPRQEYLREHRNKYFR